MRYYVLYVICALLKHIKWHGLHLTVFNKISGEEEPKAMRVTAAISSGTSNSSIIVSTAGTRWLSHTTHMQRKTNTSAMKAPQRTITSSKIIVIQRHCSVSRNVREWQMYCIMWWEIQAQGPRRSGVVVVYKCSPGETDNLWPDNKKEAKNKKVTQLTYIPGIVHLYLKEPHQQHFRQTFSWWFPCDLASVSYQWFQLSWCLKFILTCVSKINGMCRFYHDSGEMRAFFLLALHLLPSEFHHYHFHWKLRSSSDSVMGASASVTWDDCNEQLTEQEV